MAMKMFKGQLMTILIFVVFILMFAELMSFALLNVSYNNIAQSVSTGSSSSNYKTILTSSANQFAKTSLSAALSILTQYEYNATLRKGNFVSNFNQYLSSIMINGIVPNEPANSMAANIVTSYMSNATLSSYNNSIGSLFGSSAISAVANETNFAIYQNSPYTLSVSYMENVVLNSSSGRYSFSIPVSATISLNGTYDLYYAQQGILQRIKFASLSNMTTPITSVSGWQTATLGSTTSIYYGTVDYIASSSSASATCSQLPTWPGNIIVTYNAISLSGCIGSLGGLITEEYTGTPSVPYLIYPTYTSPAFVDSAQFKTGMKVLLNGPGLNVLNIEKLKNLIQENTYFASQFAPSYMDRVQGSFQNQSQNGIVTFTGYNRQVGDFNGASYIEMVPPTYLPAGNSPRTMCAWGKMYSAPTTYEWLVAYGTGASGEASFLGSNPSGGLDIGGYSGYDLVVSSFWTNHLNTWQFICATYDGSTVKAYANGTFLSSATFTWNTVLSQFRIGRQVNTGSEYWIGQLSNIQIYSNVLNASEIYQLYTRGISSIPIQSNSLVSWVPLNGNANDYSGNNALIVGAWSGTAIYDLAKGYGRDSIFVKPSSTATSPMPGILRCDTSSQCTDTTQPHLYLGSLPLTVDNNLFQSAAFTGTTNTRYIERTANSFSTGSGPRTLAAWINVPTYGTTCGAEMALSYGPSGITNSEESAIGLTNAGDLGFASNGNDYYSSLLVPKNEWTFIGATYASGSTQVTLYMNTQSVTGSLSGGVVLATPTGSNSLVGSWPNPGTCPFYGQVANAQVYNTSLSSTDMLNLYNAGIRGKPLNSPYLVSWLPLNGNPNDYSHTTSLMYSNAPFTLGLMNYTGSGLSSQYTLADEWASLGLTG